MSTNTPRPTKAQRRDDARAKAIAMRQEQERKARRTRLIAIGGLVAAVLVLGGVVLAIVRQGQANAEAYGQVVYGSGEQGVVAPALADVETPEGADESGGIVIGKDGVGDTGDGDETVVNVYFDFMCPWCGRFDAANAEELDRLAATGDVTVIYHNISFLDGNSQGTFYSTRAANAAAVVAAESPEHYTDFVTALYANQPDEGSSGLSDAKIAEIAQGVGVPASVTDQFTAVVDGTYEVGEGDSVERTGTWRTYAPFVAAATRQAGVDLGKLTTPSVLIDGEQFTGDLYTPGALTQAVEAAVGAKG